MSCCWGSSNRASPDSIVTGIYLVNTGFVLWFRGLTSQLNNKSRNNGQRTTDNGQQTTDNRQQTTDTDTDNGQRTTDNRQKYSV